jgi:nucleotide-binding universal stress UspA family protein
MYRHSPQSSERREVFTMKTLEISTAISFKNILFLTDFTEASQAACSYAMAFARKFGARLYPAHVVEAFIPTELQTPVTPEILANLVAKRSEDLAHLVKDFKAEYQVLVADGAIENVVPAWTAEHGIDLIVMGTHGRKGMDRFFLGSTAETIFRAANCPVLTVGPNVKPSSESELALNKVLFATSLTKEAEPALSYALSFAHGCDAKLAILHVVQTETEAPPYLATGVAWQKLRELVEEENLEHKPEFFVGDGDPDRRILEHAQRTRPDLIVLGLAREKTSTHFRRGIASKVVSLAPCPVLTIR